MSDLSVYLLSIVGVVVISVVLDLVIPSGQVSKYVKGIMSLVIIFVIASPLPNIIKNGINFSSLFSSTVTLDEEYLETLKTQSITLLENELGQELVDAGITGAELEIWGDLESGQIKISYIFVQTENVVLSSDLAHIDKYEAIENLLIEKTGVDEEQVVFNG